MKKIVDEIIEQININSPKELKALNLAQKEELAKNIRKYILEITSKNGGHLASNLGVVELTIALHTILNCPEDKIIWDVGHQCYTHKILTGRKKQMQTLRQYKGIAGFPKTKESEYDAFNTGHSSTSISIALGMARARDILKENYKIVAVIGDGSLTGGMALEALNDAGSSKTDMIVVLNDNQMSISKNVGGVSRFLTKLRTRKFYTNSNRNIKKITSKIPVIGEKIIRFVQKTKKIIKQMVIPNMYFEDIGFTYLGPVDGHNIAQLQAILKKSQEVKGPVLVHVITKKGKGYKFAEEMPDRFHGISKFDLNTGKKIKKDSKDYSKVFGEELIKLAKENDKIVAITAAMKDGTKLTEFAEKFPDRFFDVGITEQHAIGMIAGMAKAGLKPVFAIYSSFLQRGYDQLVHDIAIQKLPVVICIDRAGIVGNDGETHQGIFDLSFLSIIPNMTIMAPKNFAELQQMLKFAIDFNGPIAIRYPRGGEGKNKFVLASNPEIKLGRAEIIKYGRDVTIIAIGKMVDRAMEVSKLLSKKGISAEIINARFLKPLDRVAIIKSVKKTRFVVTIEDNSSNGGLGTAVKSILYCNTRFISFGYNDVFVEHGEISELEKMHGLNAEAIAIKIINEKASVGKITSNIQENVLAKKANIK